MMKRKLFNSLEMYKPTQKEIEISQTRYQQCQRLGIPYGVFDSKEGEYTPEELKALHYIHSDKPLPKELEESLLATKQQRLSNRPEPVELETISDEELDQYKH